MNCKSILVVAALLFTMASCRKENDASQSAGMPAPAPTQAMAAQHSGVVQQVLQATEYTYLNLTEGEQTYWIAVRKRDASVGDTISFSEGLEMRDFASTDLNRTFARVLFVDQVGDAATAPAMMGGPHGAPQGAPMSSGKPVLAKEAIAIDPVEGGTTIGELFAQRDSHAKQTVKVKGKVTKINRGIMGRNWVHLQDGTESNGEFDLTLTTQDDANVGDVVVFEGTVALNRDFGAGYKYDIIVEDAKRVTD